MADQSSVETDHRFACVSRVPLFTELSTDDRRRIAEAADTQKFSRGQSVQHPGDQSKLLIVHRGRVKVYRLSESGAEQLVRILGPGDFLGELSVLTGRPVDTWAEALAETEVCQVRRVRFGDLLRDHSTVALRMLAAMASRLDEAERQLSSVTGASVGRRLADHLLELAEEAGSRRFLLPSTKKDLASYLGTTPETLSRRMRALQAAGIVRFGPRGSVEILDAHALRTAEG
jgi:CRP/FNR family transcriptional regulator, anaerobic regulatory protein